MHYLLFTVLAFIWSIGFYLQKITNFAFGPITVGTCGCLGGAFILWISWFLKKSKWGLTQKHILPLIWITIIGYIYPFATTPFLIHKIGHGFIGMMVSLVPILTIFISIPILKVFPSRLQLLGVLVGFGGMFLIALDGLNRNVRPLYLVLAMLAPLCFAITNSLIQRNFRNVPSLTLVAVLMTSAGIVLAPMAIVFEKVTLDHNLTQALIAMVLFAFFCRGFGTVVFYKLIKDKGPLFAGLITYVVPLGALFWSWFDNERITLKQVATIVAILFVVVFVQKDIIARNAFKASK